MHYVRLATDDVDTTIRTQIEVIATVTTTSTTTTNSTNIENTTTIISSNEPFGNIYIYQ